jgi:MFS superfamily sulfate permease-like transporter
MCRGGDSGRAKSPVPLLVRGHAERAGLYTSILCLLGYAVFGPSRILVLGPDSPGWC